MLVLDSAPAFRALSMDIVGWELPELEVDRVLVGPVGKTDSVGECGDGGR